MLKIRALFLPEIMYTHNKTNNTITRSVSNLIYDDTKIYTFSIMFFSWILNLLKTGRKKNLEFDDLYAILDEDKTSLLGDKLEKYFFFNF